MLRAMNMERADPVALEQAVALLRAGRVSDAERLLLPIAAGSLPLSLLGTRIELHLRAGRLDAAKADLDIARAKAPGDPRVVDAAAALAMTVGNFPAAIRLLQKVLDQAPGKPRLWYRLGVVCHAAGDYRRALDAYERASVLAPGKVEPRIGRAAVWQILGHFEQARAALEDVLTIAPGHPDALTALAAQYEVRGQPRHGLALIQPLIAGASTPEMKLVYARLLRQVGRREEARAVLGSMADSVLSGHQHARLLFARADLLHDAAEFAEAFECYRQANAATPGRFDALRHRRRVSAIIDTWTRDRLRALRSVGVDSDAPVFILGMPRSGTSLVERVLSRHPAVHAGGESTAISDIERRLRGTQWVPDPDQITPAQWHEQAASYLATRQASLHRHVTDKMPANFLHLGLIQTLFPHARVIHVKRDPLDVALSCFCQDFSAPGLAWSRQLPDIAAYYSDYRRLMLHWQATLDLPMLQLEYERLVDQPGIVIRELLDFVGLDWDPVCVADGQPVATGPAGGDEAIMATASYQQVKQPIYASSVGRHKDYAEQLAPLLRMLEQAEDDR